MLELEALKFIGVITEVRRLATILNQDLIGGAENLDSGLTRSRIADIVAELRNQLTMVGAQSAWVAANRLHDCLNSDTKSITYSQLKYDLNDVESRFADHLSFIRLYVIRSEQMGLLGSPTEILGEQTASRFTSVWFDVEESAKCICVQRPTAAVFHAMRVLELGIRAFAARLNIPDPVKPAARNWANMLRQIKQEMEKQFPPEKRQSHSEGAFLEGLYATLDAVKNPWRNETMHVEGVYTDAEAKFILVCVITFIQKMAESFDEKGALVDQPPANSLLMYKDIASE